MLLQGFSCPQHEFWMNSTLEFYEVYNILENEHVLSSKRMRQGLSDIRKESVYQYM